MSSTGSPAHCADRSMEGPHDDPRWEVMLCRRSHRSAAAPDVGWERALIGGPGQAPHKKPQV